MNIKNLEARLKALGIGQEAEVSYTLDGSFCTTSIKMYINLLKKGRDVSMYHFVSGNPEKCCAMYLKTIGELLDAEAENDERTACFEDYGEGRCSY